MQRILSRCDKLKIVVSRTTTRGSSDAASRKESSVAEVSDKSRFSIRVLDGQQPVEKQSLSRGLAMNKFEKDFMIYPEYTDTEDVRNIEGFVDVLRKSLELSVDGKDIEKDGNLSPEVLEVLNSNAVFSLTVAKDFGGCGMNNKDISKVFEELSVDFNVYGNAMLSHVVANLLTIYGSEEQKSTYLPAVASGKIRPAIAIYKDAGASECKLTSGSGRSSILSGENVRVMGQHNANFFLLFASHTNPNTKEVGQACYIIDVPKLAASDKVDFRRDSTLGLKALDIGRIDISAMVTDGNRLGSSVNGPEIGGELVGNSRMPMAAAAVGLARRTLRDLAVVCNKTASRRRHRSTLADDSRSQRIVTKLALKVYALESSLYYVAGMIDEGHAVTIDIENSLISLLTRDVIQTLISAQLELVGVATSDVSLPYEKTIRDVSTLLALVDDGTDVEQIALATIATWAGSSSHKRLTSTLRRWLRNESETETMRSPGLTHYIAEHAHPSLQMACQELEFSMARINTVVSKMITSQGKNIEQDYASLEALVNVLKNNLVMVSTIARASRSYSIGLRNADIELAWATIISSRISRATWFELDALSDMFGLVKFNPSLLNAGRAVFDLGGYAIESPMEKNW